MSAWTEKVHRHWKRLCLVLSVFLIVLSIPGYIDDVGQWASWLGAIRPYVFNAEVALFCTITSVFLLILVVFARRFASIGRAILRLPRPWVRIGWSREFHPADDLVMKEKFVKRGKWEVRIHSPLQGPQPIVNTFYDDLDTAKNIARAANQEGQTIKIIIGDMLVAEHLTGRATVMTSENENRRMEVKLD